MKFRRFSNHALHLHALFLAILEPIRVPFLAFNWQKIGLLWQLAAKKSLNKFGGLGSSECGQKLKSQFLGNSSIGVLGEHTLQKSVQDQAYAVIEKRILRFVVLVSPRSVGPSTSYGHFSEATSQKVAKTVVLDRCAIFQPLLCNELTDRDVKQLVRFRIECALNWYAEHRQSLPGERAIDAVVTNLHLSARAVCTHFHSLHLHNASFAPFFFAINVA